MLSLKLSILVAAAIGSAGLISASPSPHPLWSSPLRVRQSCENDDCVSSAAALLDCLSPDVTNGEVLSCFCPSNYVSFGNCVVTDGCLVTDSYGYFENEDMDDVLASACDLYVSGYADQAANCLTSQDSASSDCDLSQLTDTDDGPVTFTSAASSANYATATSSSTSSSATTTPVKLQASTASQPTSTQPSSNTNPTKHVSSGAVADRALHAASLGAVALVAAAVLL